jgi:hypothetical protein
VTGAPCARDVYAPRSSISLRAGDGTRQRSSVEKTTGFRKNLARRTLQPVAPHAFGLWRDTTLRLLRHSSVPGSCYESVRADHHHPVRRRRDARVPKLARVGLAGYFELIVDSHEEGIEKPDPRIFVRTLDRLGVPAAEAAYVGDLYHVDVVGASAAGLSAFLLDPFDLYGGSPVARIRSLGELLADGPGRIGESPPTVPVSTS